MKKAFTFREIEYTVEECTAIAMVDLDENAEINRQNALLVTSQVNGETFTDVVFGYEMPKSDDDFRTIAEDSEAWESDEKVVKTVYTSIVEEIRSLKINSSNFEELRDTFDKNHPKEHFFWYLSDEQLVNIARTSDNYEFDEMFGIISEVLSRTKTEVPEELKEGEYQDIYEDALDKLEKSE